MTEALRLGTRGSQLAMTQSGWVAKRLSAATGRAVELVPIVTTGDVTTGPLAQMGGTGVFASALRDALLAGECDLVVHSFKDLPTAPCPGLVVAATPERESAADALCSRGGEQLGDLPPGARIGTGSPRRAAQILRARPDVEVLDLRGNVDSRLAKVAGGELDAVVLAEAGLRRIGRGEEISERFDPDGWPTSAAQGALAVECRDGSVSADPQADAEIIRMVGLLDDEQTSWTARTERAVLAALEAGCAAPVGISASITRDQGRIVAEVYGIDGQGSVRTEQAMPWALAVSEDGVTALVEAVVESLLAQGAADLPGLNGVLARAAGETAGGTDA